MAGQTLSEIRALLAEAGLSPQHRLGQHFLIDLNLLRKVVAAAELNPADTVLEIGPGTGSLTELLLEGGVRVVAVEIDRGLGAILRKRLGGHPRFTLVQGDALAGKYAVNPLVLKVLQDQPPDTGGAYKLVANLPYQIATPLLMNLLHGPVRFERLTATIQREVGQRLTAAPRTEAYGPASIVTQTLAEVSPHAILPPSAFWPRPQVESVLLTLRPRPSANLDVDDVPAFVAFVHRAFQQRRKMLRRVFREWDDAFAAHVFQRSGISPLTRPEELSPPDWRRFFRVVRQFSH